MVIDVVNQMKFCNRSSDGSKRLIIDYNQLVKMHVWGVVFESILFTAKLAYHPAHVEIFLEGWAIFNITRSNSRLWSRFFARGNCEVLMSYIYLPP